MFYVDPVFTWTEFAGHTRWCHMGTDDRSPDGLEAFHAFAERKWMIEEDEPPAKLHQMEMF